MDSYIRPNMDECGYIPVAYLCNFPNVFSICAPYEEILSALETQCKLDSFKLELDRTNEVVRLKENWKIWLVPNYETGKLGLDRYVINTNPPFDEAEEPEGAPSTDADVIDAEQLKVQVSE
jgi:hypothetical protein